MINIDDLLKKPNEFGLCHKCKGTNVDSLKPKLKELDKDAKIFVGCHSMCGPGRNKPFVIVNNKPIIADNEDTLIEKVKKEISK